LFIVATAKKSQEAIYAIGQGTVIVDYEIESKNNGLVQVISRFYLVYFVSGLQNYLFFIRTIIQMGYEYQRTKNYIALCKKDM